jgi:hypothetical protein
VGSLDDGTRTVQRLCVRPNFENTYSRELAHAVARVTTRSISIPGFGRHDQPFQFYDPQCNRRLRLVSLALRVRLLRGIARKRTVPKVAVVMMFAINQASHLKPLNIRDL